MPFFRKDPNLKEAERAEELGEWEKAIKYYQEYIDNEKKAKKQAKANLSIAKIYLWLLRDFTKAKSHAQYSQKHKKEESKKLIILASELAAISDERLINFFFDVYNNFLDKLIVNSHDQFKPIGIRSVISTLDFRLVTTSNKSIRILIGIVFSHNRYSGITETKVIVEAKTDLQLTFSCETKILRVQDEWSEYYNSGRWPRYLKCITDSGEHDNDEETQEEFGNFVYQLISQIAGGHQQLQFSQPESKVLKQYSQVSKKSNPFFCAICEQKHLAGTPKMQCEACGRSICVDAFSEMAKAGRMTCPMCDGKLNPIT